MAEQAGRSVPMLNADGSLVVPASKRDVLMLSAYMRRLFSLAPGTGGSGDIVLPPVPSEVARLLLYLLDPQGAPVPAPRSFTEWLRLQVDWDRARRYLQLPSVCVPMPYKPQVDWLAELQLLHPGLHDLYCKDVRRLLMYGSTARPDMEASEPPATTRQASQQQQQQHASRQLADLGAFQFADDASSVSGGVHDPHQLYEPLLDLYPWDDPAAAHVWPAGSLTGLPEHLLLRSPNGMHSSHMDGGNCIGIADNSGQQPARKDASVVVEALPHELPRAVLASNVPSSSSSNSNGPGGVEGSSSDVRVSWAALLPFPLRAATPTALEPPLLAPQGPGPGPSTSAACSNPTSCASPGPSAAMSPTSSSSWLQALNTAAATGAGSSQGSPAGGTATSNGPAGAPSASASSAPSQSPQQQQRQQPGSHQQQPAQAQEYIPWWSTTRWDGVVLAGGGVVSMLHPGTKAEDFDLFLVVPSTDAMGAPRSKKEREEIAAKLTKQVCRSLLWPCPDCGDPHTDVFALLDASVVTLLLMDPPDAYDYVSRESVVLKVQVVARLYDSPAQVVHGFDLDAAAVMFDGEGVWATERCLRALHTRTLVVEPIRQSPSYEYRLSKYCVRYGLDIVVPGLHPVLRAVVTEPLDMLRQQVMTRAASTAASGFSSSGLSAAEEAAARQARMLTQSLKRALSGRTSLARLMLLHYAACNGVSAEELNAARSDYNQFGDTRDLGRLYVYTFFAEYNGWSEGQSRLVKASSGLGEWDRAVRNYVNWKTAHVSSQAGKEHLFTGSFTHTPHDNWYTCALSDLQSKYERGEVDLEDKVQTWLAGLPVDSPGDEGSSADPDAPSTSAEAAATYERLRQVLLDLRQQRNTRTQGQGQGQGQAVAAEPSADPPRVHLQPDGPGMAAAGHGQQREREGSCGHADSSEVVEGVGGGIMGSWLRKVAVAAAVAAPYVVLVGMWLHRGTGGRQ